jgi:isocitrate dehydrogenase
MIVHSPYMSNKIPITHGDGIGPEIMEASLHILQEAGAELEIETIEIGEKVYMRGNSAGIDPASWKSLRRTKVFYKAPITTPQGGGFKSLNVTARKRLGLYANIRPCVAYAPYVDTRHPGMDAHIVRENEEDLYAGIEYQLSSDVMECLKLISRPGSEKIVRFAFEYARQNARRKVTCFTKDNIMKMTDGLFHKVYDEIGAEYPEIEKEHWIVDIGAAKLADTPTAFDVIVMPNLYGDVLSDAAAQIAGSVGLAGSAPRRAGQNLANPSGPLLGGVMMLVHIGQWEAAERVHNVWLRTLEDGIHTCDIYEPSVSKEKVGTKEFAQAVVARIGKKPEKLKVISYAGAGSKRKEWTPNPRRGSEKIEVVGVDFYMGSKGLAPQQFGDSLSKISLDGLVLRMMDNRGTIVWPGGMSETFVVDNYRCRFQVEGDTPITQDKVAALYQKLIGASYDVVKIETLRTFDGKQGFTLAQGQ